MTYNKRKYPIAPWHNKPSSPTYRKERWVTLILRSVHYAMLREMSAYQNMSIGQVAMEAIEKEFNRVLKEIDPKAKEFVYVPPPTAKKFKNRKRPQTKPPASTAINGPGKKPVWVKRTVEEVLQKLQDEITPKEPEPLQEPPPTEAPPSTEPVEENPIRRKIHVSRF